MSEENFNTCYYLIYTTEEAGEYRATRLIAPSLKIARQVFNKAKKKGEFNGIFFKFITLVQAKDNWDFVLKKRR